MSKRSYQKRIEKLKNNQKYLQALKFLYRALPFVMIITFPAMIIIKATKGFSIELCFMIFVPAVTLLLVTFIRKVVDRQRPYTKYDTAPLIPKKSSGESFPSRHTASAFIIAMSAFGISSILAYVLLAIAVLIGITRILAGVHFLTDVLAGMGISVLIGYIFFILL